MVRRGEAAEVVLSVVSIIPHICVSSPYYIV